MKNFGRKTCPNIVLLNHINNNYRTKLSKEVDHKICAPLNGLRSLIWRPIIIFFFTLKSGAHAFFLVFKPFIIINMNCFK